MSGHNAGVRMRHNIGGECPESDEMHEGFKES